MQKDTCHIFISHIHEDDPKLNNMKTLLKKHGCTAKDSSINSTKPNQANNEIYIKNSILAPRIKWAGTLVVLISPGTRDSKWVDWEIQYAHRLGKRIVGVWDYGANECDVPRMLDLYANAVVGWRGESIIDAIFGKTDNWETPNGGSRPERDIARHNC
ncbi:hypothetical protein CCAX7_11380 [Capsulimonas corticalis]|uniref:Thoeris protein ThsB TIR-like domain-containing protein n=1 Tax=Capsulimonas corticalis TaxID=2219043 RepID=A0A402CUU4_9BACT|nr:TIR domain-containing protein [Capsulimonas corticalis]BDI29087.1 hypothetical protein CCAX7_11380 [Capsulimonas corticalis]